MLINIQDDIIRLHAAGLLTKLLSDKTTGKNIMWATDAYAEHGTRYERNEQIMPELITGTNTGIIKTRARKAFEQQTERTRRRAEVFTPLWICRKMTDHYYNECMTDSDPKKLIDSRQLEITCGEAPFLVSRYDTTTGEIIPIAERIGLLDRKLRIVGENAKGEKEWLSLAKRAYESTYGYEFQGDNLLIARVNLIETFAEYMRDRWLREPTAAEMRPIINIIVWNMWQMDGLSGVIPYHNAEEDNVQLSFFDDEEDEELTQPPCRIYDWRANNSFEYSSIAKGNRTMKFDFIIGNPPYQEDRIGTSDASIFHFFMDSTYEVSDRVELITPAKFLFDAGDTPSRWNHKMLNDPHFKVLIYEPNAKKIFSNVSFEGGVAITYRDTTKDYGAIGVFTAYENLNSIVHKVSSKTKNTLNEIMSLQNKFDLDQLYSKYPNAKKSIGSKGKESRLTTSIFSTLDIFREDEFSGSVKILGLISANRVYRYIDSDVLKQHISLYKYKVIMPKSNGASGTLGENPARIISKPIVGEPKTGYTQSFIGIGAFDTEMEANATLKYVKTKFARCMLGVLKVTQDNNPETWKYVPLQDFTPNSDIDWSKSIPEIDKQLYAKYGLTDDEITFIETHVKEMS